MLALAIAKAYLLWSWIPIVINLRSILRIMANMNLDAGCGLHQRVNSTKHRGILACGLVIVAISLSACSLPENTVPTANPLAHQVVSIVASPIPKTHAFNADQLAAAPQQDVTVTPTFGPAVGGPTPTPTELAIATGIQPTFGPVVGPGYVPPPSNTPRPPELTPANGTLPPVNTPGPSPTPGPTLRSDLMGIQIFGNLTDEQWSQILNQCQELGVGWIKVQVPWAEFEPAPGQYTEKYHALILNIQRANIRGFKTMLSFDKAPAWARPQNAATIENGPSDDPQTFATFVQKFVREVKPEFIDAVEVWNEPNLIREWRGKPMNGAEYMKYFDVAYKTIISEQRFQPSTLKPNHRIIVITAGPAPTGTSPNGASLNDREWLQQLYDNGLAKYGDDVAVGIHPYGWANSPEALCCKAADGVTGWFENPVFYFRNTIEDYHKLMLKNNHTNGKLWITEFGWASYEGLHQSNGAQPVPGSGVEWEGILNQSQQAEYIVRAFQMAQHTPYYDYLGPMMLWNLNYASIPTMTDTASAESAFSLLNDRGQPRPAYATLKNTIKIKPQ